MIPHPQPSNSEFEWQMPCKSMPWTSASVIPAARVPGLIMPNMAGGGAAAVEMAGYAGIVLLQEMMLLDFYT